MSPYSARGTAQFGIMKTSWPLAQLTSAPELLTVKAPFLGEYWFTPEQVVSIERYCFIPVLAWGIRIRHTDHHSPETIVFLRTGSPETVLRGIRASGFVPAAPADALPMRRGMPARWTVIAAAALLWNAMLLMDFGWPPFGASVPGPWTLAALALVFSAALGTLLTPEMQKLVLKPGRSVGEIEPFLLLLVGVSGMMLVILTLFTLLGVAH